MVPAALINSILLTCLVLLGILVVSYAYLIAELIFMRMAFERHDPRVLFVPFYPLSHRPFRSLAVPQYLASQAIQQGDVPLPAPEPTTTTTTTASTTNNNSSCAGSTTYSSNCDVDRLETVVHRSGNIVSVVGDQAATNMLNGFLEGSTAGGGAMPSRSTSSVSSSASGGGGGWFLSLFGKKKKESVAKALLHSQQQKKVNEPVFGLTLPLKLSADPAQRVQLQLKKMNVTLHPHNENSNNNNNNNNNEEMLSISGADTEAPPTVDLAMDGGAELSESTSLVEHIPDVSAVDTMHTFVSMDAPPPTVPKVAGGYRGKQGGGGGNNQLSAQELLWAQRAASIGAAYASKGRGYRGAQRIANYAMQQLEGGSGVEQDTTSLTWSRSIKKIIPNLNDVTMPSDVFENLWKMQSMRPRYFVLTLTTQLLAENRLMWNPTTRKPVLPPCAKKTLTAADLESPPTSAVRPGGNAISAFAAAGPTGSDLFSDHSAQSSIKDEPIVSTAAASPSAMESAKEFLAASAIADNNHRVSYEKKTSQAALTPDRCTTHHLEPATAEGTSPVVLDRQCSTKLSVVEQDAAELSPYDTRVAFILGADRASLLRATTVDATRTFAFGVVNTLLFYTEEDSRDVLRRHMQQQDKETRRQLGLALPQSAAARGATRAGGGGGIRGSNKSSANRLLNNNNNSRTEGSVGGKPSGSLTAWRRVNAYPSSASRPDSSFKELPPIAQLKLQPPLPLAPPLPPAPLSPDLPHLNDTIQGTDTTETGCRQTSVSMTEMPRQFSPRTNSLDSSIAAESREREEEPAVAEQQLQHQHQHHRRHHSAAPSHDDGTHTAGTDDGVFLTMFSSGASSSDMSTESNGGGGEDHSGDPEPNSRTVLMDEEGSTAAIDDSAVVLIVDSGEAEAGGKQNGAAPHLPLIDDVIEVSPQPPTRRHLDVSYSSKDAAASDSLSLTIVTATATDDPMARINLGEYSTYSADCRLSIPGQTLLVHHSGQQAGGKLGEDEVQLLGISMGNRGSSSSPSKWGNKGSRASKATNEFVLEGVRVVPRPDAVEVSRLALDALRNRLKKYLRGDELEDAGSDLEHTMTNEVDFNGRCTGRRFSLRGNRGATSQVSKRIQKKQRRKQRRQLIRRVLARPHEADLPVAVSVLFYVNPPPFPRAYEWKDSHSDEVTASLTAVEMQPPMTSYQTTARCSDSEKWCVALIYGAHAVSVTRAAYHAQEEARDADLGSIADSSWTHYHSPSTHYGSFAMPQNDGMQSMKHSIASTRAFGMGASAASVTDVYVPSQSNWHLDSCSGSTHNGGDGGDLSERFFDPNSGVYEQLTDERGSRTPPPANGDGGGSDVDDAECATTAEEAEATLRQITSEFPHFRMNSDSDERGGVNTEDHTAAGRDVLAPMWDTSRFREGLSVPMALQYIRIGDSLYSVTEVFDRSFVQYRERRLQREDPLYSVRSAHHARAAGNGEDFSSEESSLNVSFRSLADMMANVQPPKRTTRRSRHAAVSTLMFGDLTYSFSSKGGGGAADDGDSTRELVHMCYRCLTSEAAVIFLPCGHFAACVSCGEALKDCCVCQAQIDATVVLSS